MKLKYRLAPAMLIVLSVVACYNTDTVKNNAATILEVNQPRFETRTTVDKYTFELLSYKYNGKLKSDLSVFEGQNLLFMSTNAVDSIIPAYKLMVYKDIIINAENLKPRIPPLIIGQIIEEFEIFGKSIIASGVGTHTAIYQDIFYHNAILNTIKRSYVNLNNNDCECLPHPGYFVGQTPFWCQEDYKVNAESFADIIRNSDSPNLPNKNEVLSLLENYNQPEISIDQVFEFIETKEVYLTRIQSVFNEGTNLQNKCFQGTALGCCGNYSGCCWYSSYACLEHDLACLRCDKWHCGPGCVPNF